MQKVDTATRWLQASEGLELHSHQVDVWRIALDLPPATIKRLESALSTDEDARATRFRFPAGRDRFIVAHAGLRHILARYLGCHPDQIRFSMNEYGKPVLQGKHLEFNLSHSGDFALVAATWNKKIGVDVERFRPEIELGRLANRFFSPGEVAELNKLPPEGKVAGFFNCWSRKEAYIKAQGLGLSLPLDSFDVSIKEPALLHATRPDPSEAARWTMRALDVAPGYAAAVVAEGHGLDFRFWDS
jgi:4'-phosphopantetheinyl transferase